MTYNYSLTVSDAESSNDFHEAILAVFDIASRRFPDADSVTGYASYLLGALGKAPQ